MADLSITAANVDAGDSAKTDSGVSGEAITAGQAVYVDSTDSNKVKLADADDAAKYVCVGIAINSAPGANQPISYVTSDDDLDIGATLTVGEIYVLSGTAGGVCPKADLAAGDYTRILGVANATDSLRVHIHANNGADTVIA